MASWPDAGQPPVDTFRSSSGRGLAVAWWAVSVFALGDLAFHGRDDLALRISLGIAVSDLLVWLGGWRPAVLLYPGHVVLRGSVRDRAVALQAVTAATAIGPLRLRAGGRVFTAASIGSTVRERRRAGRETTAVPLRTVGAFGGVRRGGGLGGGLGGLGGFGGRGARSVGFDDSRMDAATRDALVGRTAGAHAAERISAEAERLRRTDSAPADPVYSARFAPVPGVAALLGIVALVLVFLV
jgi:hypothetical protein